MKQVSDYLKLIIDESIKINYVYGVLSSQYIGPKLDLLSLLTIGGSSIVIFDIKDYDFIIGSSELIEKA